MKQQHRKRERRESCKKQLTYRKCVGLFVGQLHGWLHACLQYLALTRNFAPEQVHVPLHGPAARMSKTDNTEQHG